MHRLWRLSTWVLDLCRAIDLYYSAIQQPSSPGDIIRVEEAAIASLSDLLAQEKRREDLRQPVDGAAALFFRVIPLAKTAKIARGIMDAVAKIPCASYLGRWWSGPDG